MDTLTGAALMTEATRDDAPIARVASDLAPSSIAPSDHARKVVVLTTDDETEALLASWASARGFDLSRRHGGEAIPAGHPFGFHLTLFATDGPVGDDLPVVDIVVAAPIVVRAIGFDVLGPNADVPVLTIGDADGTLTAIRDALLDATAATPTYADFKPHVTLSYAWSGTPAIEDLPMPSFPITLDRMSIRAIDAPPAVKMMDDGGSDIDQAMPQWQALLSRIETELVYELGRDVFDTGIEMAGFGNINSSAVNQLIEEAIADGYEDLPESLGKLLDPAIVDQLILAVRLAELVHAGAEPTDDDYRLIGLKAARSSLPVKGLADVIYEISLGYDPFLATTDIGMMDEAALVPHREALESAIEAASDDLARIAADAARPPTPDDPFNMGPSGLDPRAAEDAAARVSDHIARMTERIAEIDARLAAIAGGETKAADIGELPTDEDALRAIHEAQQLRYAEMVATFDAAVAARERIAAYIESLTAEGLAASTRQGQADVRAAHIRTEIDKLMWELQSADDASRAAQVEIDAIAERMPQARRGLEDRETEMATLYAEIADFVEGMQVVVDAIEAAVAAEAEMAVSVA